MNGYGVVKVHLTTRRTSGEKAESFCLSTFFLTQKPFYKARFEKISICNVVHADNLRKPQPQY